MVVTGILPVGVGNTSTIAYPTGFTKDNTLVISAEAVLSNTYTTIYDGVLFDVRLTSSEIELTLRQSNYGNSNVKIALLKK